MTAKQLQKKTLLTLLEKLFVTIQNHSVTLNPSKRLKPNKRMLN